MALLQARSPVFWPPKASELYHRFSLSIPPTTFESYHRLSLSLSSVLAFDDLRTLLEAVSLSSLSRPPMILELNGRLILWFASLFPLLSRVFPQFLLISVLAVTQMFY